MLLVVEAIPFTSYKEMTKLLRMNKRKKTEVHDHLVLVIQEVQENE